MFTVSKKEGASSSAGGNVQKGTKGRIETFFFRDGEGTFTFLFKDFGNYGRERWFGQIDGITKEELTEARDVIQELLDANVETTQVEFVEPSEEATESVSADAVPDPTPATSKSSKKNTSKSSSRASA